MIATMCTIASTSSNSLRCDNCWISNFSKFKNPTSKEQIIKSLQEKKFPKKEYLMESGDSANGIYCIKEGTVKVSKKGTRNKELTLWIAGPGDVVGLNSFINNEPFSFSASAVNPVTACFILASDLRILLNKEPMIFIQLMKKLCDKLNIIEQRITSISRKNIREVCAEMLISIAVQNKSENKKSAVINYSINDLACLVGTTKNYLYKILLEFTDKKIIAFHNRKLTVVNMEALSLIAEGK